MGIVGGILNFASTSNFTDKSEGKGDARQLEEVSEECIVSLVKWKAVNANVNEPKNPELWDAQQVWEWFYDAF